MVLWGAVLWIAGCAIPMGDNLTINRDGNTLVTYITDYNLQSYVPIPKPGEPPVTQVSRGDLDLTVVWKDHTGLDVSSLPVFQAATVYRAEIKLTPRSGYGFNPSLPFAYHPGKISLQIDDLGEPTRTVTVTYNNSDDWDITYITDYNLQNYIPVPIADERPVRALDTREDMRVTAEWKVENPPDSAAFVPIDTADSFTFDLGAVYRADIRLVTKPGYRFSGTGNFTYTDGSQTTPVGSAADPETRGLNVTYSPTRAPRVISDFNLTTYVTKPVGGATAVGTFAAPQYTGALSWRNTVTQAALAGPFQPGTAYTAELVLTAASGYTLTGVAPNAFVHTGAETISSGAGTVTIGFPPTPNAPSPAVVYDTILTGYIPKPASRVTPVASFTGSQYTGTVVWRNTGTQAALVGQFQTGVSYTAVVTLTPIPGYAFTGIAQNVFSHAASSSVINQAGSGMVTINFPPAGAYALSAVSFGPVDAEGSALKLMKERKDDNNPVTIELPGGVEELVVPDTVSLLADHNCPVNITIDGGGRVLRIDEPGTLLAVRNGITLTLKNITLRGMAPNNKPLVLVQTGGRLILGAGAAITGNRAAARVGGVWVSGGEFTMQDGSLLRDLHGAYDANGYIASSAGGVSVGGGGKFIMNGGTIEDCSSAGNADTPGGGGVFVAGVEPGGTFTMYGGTIQNNVADNEWGGAGGVYNEGGTFTMHGGAIKNNECTNAGAGGVYGAITMKDGTIEGNQVLSSGGGGVNGYLVMYKGSIKNNVAHGSASGGGVNGSLVMYNGTIEGNRAEGAGSGGGVWVSSEAQISGGTITGNTGYGMYVSFGWKFNYPSPPEKISCNFTISGSARVDPGNKVFLAAPSMITIGGTLSADPAAVIIHETPGPVIHVLTGTEALLKQNYQRFRYDGGQIGAPYDGGDGFWYADYVDSP
jgi:hypothetical protein